FAALPGARQDGGAFIPAALAAGAAAVLTAPEVNVPDGVPHLVAEQPRRALAQLASRLYRRQPARVVAVTGTNGKSSTAHFTRDLWQAMGLRAAALGTL